MAQMTTFVEDKNLRKSISIIQDYTLTNDNTRAKMEEEFDSLKASIIVGNRTFPNKKENAVSSINNFRKTGEGCINVFNHVIQMYFDAHDSSLQHFSTKEGKF